MASRYRPSSALSAAACGRGKKEKAMSPRKVLFPGAIEMTERELAASIIHAARECGWLVARTWLSKFSPAGEPDLRMVKEFDNEAIMLVAELKGTKGHISPAQAEWLRLLGKVRGIRTFVWKPEHLEQIYLLLMGTPDIIMSCGSNVGCVSESST